MPVKGRIVVTDNYCKGCRLCVEACPQGVLDLSKDRINIKGYHPAELIAEGCTGAEFVPLSARRRPLPFTAKLLQKVP